MSVQTIIDELLSDLK